MPNLETVRLLWLSQLIPYPPKGGVLQRSFNLLHQVAKYHDVYLLAFVQRPMLEMLYEDPDAGQREAMEALSSFCREVRFFDIPADRRTYGRHLLALRSLLPTDPYTINWLKSPEYAAGIRDLSARVPFDLVHFDTISLAPYRTSIRAPATVLDHHNIESHMMLRRAYNEANLVRRLYFLQEGHRLLAYERRHCPRFDLNITCSSLDTERLREHVPALSIKEIPNGVDLEYFQPGAAPETPNTVIFAGALSWYPNRRAAVYVAEKLWPLLKREIPDITFHLVGAQPPPELVELEHRDNAFHVHGYVDDVRPYLSGSAVYLCPISDGGGTKLKLLDAFAMEKAVVAHPVACEGIDAVRGQHVLMATQPEEYVQHIKTLLASPERRRELGHRARELVAAQYSYDKIGLALSMAYEECLASGMQSRTKCTVD